MMDKKSFWHNKDVFVTGCNGFVGSWLVKALIERGAVVVGLIRDLIPNSGLIMLGCLDKIKIVSGDVENYDLLERVLNDYGIEICFHLAAQSQVGVANRLPVSTFKTNFIGTLNVLEAARNIGSLKCIVIASSDKAYGCHKDLPYKEDFALRGTYPYDASKACADILSQAYFNAYKLPVSISRCANIFGGADLNFNRIIPDTMRSLIHNKLPIIRSDGKYIREYLYVKDAVSAYLTLAESLSQKETGVAGQAFNFGTCKPLSVIDVVDMIIKVSGKKNIRPKILNIANSEIKEQYLSSEKAYKILKWKPQYDLEAALKETYLWYSEFYNLKR